MRAPICAVCSEFANNNDLKSGHISFALTEKEKEFNEQFTEPGFIGQPMGMEWFCGKHYDLAFKLKHLSSFEAIKLLKEAEKKS